MITIRGPLKFNTPEEFKDWRLKMAQKIVEDSTYKGDKDEQYKVVMHITIRTRNLDNRKVPRIDTDNVAKTVTDILAIAGIFGGEHGKMWDSNVRETSAQIKDTVENGQSEKLEIEIYHKKAGEAEKWEKIPIGIEI